MRTPAPSKKTAQKVVPHGRLYVTASFNNTLATVTDDKGAVLCWASTGSSGFSGSRKSTPYAATVTIENAVSRAKLYGMHTMDVFLKGPGPGRDAALRVLKAQRVNIKLLADMTPIPHNGTRPRKAKHHH